MAPALERAPVGVRPLHEVRQVGQRPGCREREPVAQRFGDAGLALHVLGEMRQRVSAGVAVLVGDLLVAAGERHRLERHEADLVAVLERELHDRPHLIVVHGVDDCDDEAHVDARRVQTGPDC